MGIANAEVSQENVSAIRVTPNLVGTSQLPLIL